MRSTKKSSVFRKIEKYADSIETAIASVSFVFMCLFVLTTIVFRYVLHQPIMWTEEASRYLMITGIFLAMPVAVHEHVHLGVEVFINVLPKTAKRIVGVFSEVVTLAAYIAIDYACYKFVLSALSSGQTSPAMHIPMVAMYFIIFLGFLLATIVQVANMIDESIAMRRSNEDGGIEK